MEKESIVKKADLVLENKKSGTVVYFSKNGQGVLNEREKQQIVDSVNNIYKALDKEGMLKEGQPKSIKKEDIRFVDGRDKDSFDDGLEADAEEMGL